METSRLEAFSDGVLAIIITVMVLELKVPHGTSLTVLEPILPVFLCYILSFVYLGIYWNNHHHMFQLAKKVTGAILWANLHLLFWLSLIPFTTAWLGENHFETLPSALYGVVLFMAALAYWLLQKTILIAQGKDSILAKAIGSDLKGKISPALYLTAILISFFQVWIADLIYVFVALIWLVPDKRIERILALTEKE